MLSSLLCGALPPQACQLQCGIDIPGCRSLLGNPIAKRMVSAQQTIKHAQCSPS